MLETPLKQNEAPEVDAAAAAYLESASGCSALEPFETYRSKEPENHMCDRCILDYKERFDKGETKKVFPPVCVGPYSQYKGLSKDMFLQDGNTEEEWVVYSTMNNPIKWAEQELGWVTRGFDKVKKKNMNRWYQRELLDCSAERKILRSGRRIGKTDSLVVNALFKAANNKDFKVLVIAPYEAQVQVFFKRIDELVAESATLKYKVTRRRSNPEYIEFSNGATIKGFCSSASSGGNGGNKVRGQSANYIILDESDYLMEADMEAIMAILASDSKCLLHEASTPTGARQGFWKRATDKSQGFKEFHYYSHISPEYTKEVDDYFRSNYSYDGYLREFLAEFGEETLGVFQKEKILSNIGEYTLAESRQEGPQPGWHYILGADWNGRAIGVHMVVVGLNPLKEEYKIVDKQVVKQKQFTQDSAVKTMIQMHKYWGTEFMYVDQGYGEYQVETIQKIGYDANDIDLMKAIKPIAMGGTRMIIDPITKEEEKKNTKPFSINLTAQKVERGQITFPQGEDYMNDDEWGIVAEFCGFQIVRIGENGAPKYSREHDHSLTSVVLAILGFMENMTDMAKRMYAKEAHQIGGRREGESTLMDKDAVQQKFKKDQKDLQKNRFTPRSQGDSFFGQDSDVKLYDSSLLDHSAEHGPMVNPGKVKRRNGLRTPKRSTF